MKWRLKLIHVRSLSCFLHHSLHVSQYIPDGMESGLENLIGGVGIVAVIGILHGIFNVLKENANGL